MTDFHPCPVAGCEEKKLPARLLMCAPHWRTVPQDLQRLVNKTWRKGSTREYVEARKQAIEAAEIKERCL